jgi:hypothetical protein
MYMTVMTCMLTVHNNSELEWQDGSGRGAVLEVCRHLNTHPKLLTSVDQSIKVCRKLNRYITMLIITF